MKTFRVFVLLIVFGFILTTAMYPGEHGIKFGVNFSRLSGSGSDFGSQPGLIFGVFNRVDLKWNFAVQGEIYCSMKGADSLSYEIKMNYLELPTLLVYNIPTGGKIRPNIFVGYYAAFKLLAVAKRMYLSGSEDEELEVKKKDSGIVFGGSVLIDIGSGKLIVDARYSKGLSKIVESGPVDIKNSAFTLMLGYAFK
jgi:hypothetical protein